jgi:hypothetical protein
MVKRKMAKGQTLIYKTQSRKLPIEQQKLGVNSGAL